MNSKWQINRIGLIDFWYYDDEEFYFSDGRMLLRGSNGSGKSVTMQSFIPLLLDGNMRPERLDPFGSRARKMDNYLLEENDSREERTGYLYMEFKRAESNTYLTVGIGMRARKAKKLDTWYFSIQDGRRIKKDFFLYRDVHNKIVYTKQELRNRIADGGKVLDSQNEYMVLVNKLIFGFDTIEEYKEMIELLIQLRTPKLSKDFKPTVINDILSNSLQPLSEDDLRPMSEAIENMDNLKTNLDNLKQSRDAAKKIHRVYDRYNNYILYEKAKQYKNSYDRQTHLDQTVKNYEKEIKESEEQRIVILEKLTDLSEEERVLKEEEDSLNSSDAQGLKEKENRFISDTEELTKELDSKNRILSSKKDRRIDIEQLKKKKNDELENTKQKIEESFVTMEENVQNITFDEHAFMVQDIKNNMEKPYRFETHNTMLQSLINRVEEGIDGLKEESYQKARYDERLKSLDDCRKERDSKEKELIQYENQTIEIKNELQEKIYRWNDSNKLLQIDKELLREVAISIEAFHKDSDYGEVKDLIRPSKQGLTQSILNEGSEYTRQKNYLEEEIANTRAELEEWKNQKDPEPERPEEVKRNREKLKEEGIIYHEFYKTIDFAQSITGDQANNLEEALLSMGILDSLIVSTEDKEAILKLDRGLCDKYIFSDVEKVKSNLNDWLDVENDENNILFYHQISNALSGISYLSEGHTSIYEDGSYRLGALSGTITKEYKAKYIGVKARASYRQKMITQKEEERQLQLMELKKLETEITNCKEAVSLIDQEWNHFPSGEDLRIAIKAYEDIQDQLERVQKECKRQDETLREEQKKLEVIQGKVREICAKVYLTAKLELFLEAKDGLLEYRSHLNDVQVNHSKYCEGCHQILQFDDQLIDLDQDIDQLLSDMNKINVNIRTIKQNIISIQKQLELTNYEEVKERLNYCVSRLEQIPREKEDGIKNAQNLLNNMESNKNVREDNLILLENTIKRTKILEHGFLLEYELPFQSVGFSEEKDSSILCSKIYSALDGTFGNKRKEDFISDLQEVFHQNRGWLTEYHLTLDSLFGEMDEDRQVEDIQFKRFDLTGKYRGVVVKFNELLDKIEIDIEEQTNLLNDQDRELFEDILANTISKKIRSKIYNSNSWVDKMNNLMNSMKTSSGLTLSLRWKSKRAEHEDQLDTRHLVELLKKDSEIMKDEEFIKLSAHFRSKIQEARKLLEQTDSVKSFHTIMKEILDYRNWFEFQLECKKSGENKKELTDRVFFTFSGGEKAMAMYVPLFSAVVAKYQGARMDAPRLISLDEAFAGVDEMNIKDMFRLMVEFEFAFIINSQILWGDCDTVPSIAIYQLIRPENAKFVTVISYIWNGTSRELVDHMEEYIEQG